MDVYYLGKALDQYTVRELSIPSSGQHKNELVDRMRHFLIKDALLQVDEDGLAKQLTSNPIAATCEAGSDSTVGEGVTITPEDCIDATEDDTSFFEDDESRIEVIRRVDVEKDGTKNCES